eukprot:g3808.t1
MTDSLLRDGGGDDDKGVVEMRPIGSASPPPPTISISKAKNVVIEKSSGKSWKEKFQARHKNHKIKIPGARHVKEVMGSSLVSTRHIVNDGAIKRAASSIVHLTALTIAKNRLKSDQAKQVHGSGKYVLRPGSRQFFWWDIVVMISVGFTLIYTPLQVVLDKPYGNQGDFLFYFRFFIDRVVDVIFLTDVAVTFRTARSENDGTIYFDANEIAWKYLRGRFVFDLFVAFPWDLLVLACEGGKFEEFSTGTEALLRLPRLIKLFRVTRILNITKRWESHIKMNYRTVNALTTFGSFLLLLHWIACGWMLASTLLNSDESWPVVLTVTDTQEKYSVAIYWALTTLTTIGYGDVTPVLGNNVELWFNVFTMFIGAAVYAYVVGKVSEYVASKHAAREHFEKRVTHLKSYMSKFDIPPKLRDRINRYCLFIRTSEKTKFKMDGLNLLSPALRQELSLHVHIESLSNSTVFNAFVSSAVVAEAATLLQPLLYGPDEVVVSAGDKCSYMYFVRDGRMLTESTRARIGSIDAKAPTTDGDVNAVKIRSFGDGNVVFVDASQRITVVTLTFSNMLRLEKKDMMKVWANYSDCWQNAKRQLVLQLWREILTSGAITSYAGLKTSSSWRKPSPRLTKRNCIGSRTSKRRFNSKSSFAGSFRNSRWRFSPLSKSSTKRSTLDEEEKEHDDDSAEMRAEAESARASSRRRIERSRALTAANESNGLPGFFGSREMIELPPASLSPASPTRQEIRDLRRLVLDTNERMQRLEDAIRVLATEVQNGGT